MNETRERDQDALSPGGRIRWIGATIILLFWLVILVLVILIILRIFKRSA